mgnify:CR=1 FL=1
MQILPSYSPAPADCDVKMTGVIPGIEEVICADGKRRTPEGWVVQSYGMGLDCKDNHAVVGDAAAEGIFYFLFELIAGKLPSVYGCYNLAASLNCSS